MPYLRGVGLAACPCAEFGEVRLGELALVFYFFFIVYGIVFPVRCTDGVVWQAIAASVGLVAR